MNHFSKYVGFLGVVLVSFCIGCKKELKPEDFLQTIASDASINKKYEDGMFRIVCSYRPPDFLALGELQKSLNSKILKESYNVELKKFENGMYFDLSIGLTNQQNIVTQAVSSQAEYARLLSELTYNLTRDVYVVLSERDTIRAITYNYSNSYGAGTDARFLFVFPKSILTKEGKHFDLVYQDKIFGLKDIVHFKFDVPDLVKKLPEIKF